jgi:DNA-binding IclR family transcriptional regulator
VAANVSSAADLSYTAERVVRALELIARGTDAAPAVASALGVHPRTARRILRTLVAHQYASGKAGRGCRGHSYAPTVRVLALAAQAAHRIPLVQHSRRCARALHRATGLAAYVAIPSYEHVLVIARAGDFAPDAWDTLPALSEATGRMLLAHREPWRRSFPDQSRMSDDEAEAIRVRGDLILDDERRNGQASLALPVPSGEPPIAAVALRGPLLRLLGQDRALIAREVLAAFQHR